MASELEQQYDDILAAAEKAATPEVKPVETPAEEKEITEESGVDKAAEDSNDKADSTEEEGQKPSDEWEEELKNVDPELRETLKAIQADAILSTETKNAIIKAQISAAKKQRASFDRKQTEFGHEKKIAETGKQLFQKYGIDPNSGFSRVEKLINFEAELEKDPRKVIKLLQAKFNLHDEPSGSDEEKLDESLLTDEERIILKKQKNIEKTVETLVEENRRLKESREREVDEKAMADVLNFRDEKNDDGTLKNPYFEDLAADIIKLADVYKDDSLQKLYNRALRMNDDVYNKSINDVKDKERKRILSEKEAALKKAKSINSQSIKSSNTSEKRSLDDTLFAILENSSN